MVDLHIQSLFNVLLFIFRSIDLLFQSLLNAFSQIPLINPLQNDNLVWVDAGNSILLTTFILISIPLLSFIIKAIRMKLLPYLYTT